MGFLSSNSYFDQYIWVRHLQALRCLKPSWGQTPPQKIILLWICPHPPHTKSTSTNIMTSLVSPFCYWNHTTPCHGEHWMYAQYCREVHPDILQPTIPRSVSSSVSNSEFCWDLCGLLKELCSHWYALIHWLFYSLTAFYFHCIPLLLSFILPAFQEYYGDLLLTHRHGDEI